MSKTYLWTKGRRGNGVSSGQVLVGGPEKGDGKGRVGREGTVGTEATEPGVWFVEVRRAGGGRGLGIDLRPVHEPDKTEEVGTRVKT